MVTIFHNPRCSKSRGALQLLEGRGLSPKIIRYLDVPPTAEALAALILKLGIRPRDLMRKGEALYTELGLDDEGLKDDALIDAMVRNPILIERPLVVTEKGVRIGRPLENILDIL